MPVPFLLFVPPKQKPVEISALAQEETTAIMIPINFMDLWMSTYKAGIILYWKLTAAGSKNCL